jgi:hypothetical protein
MIKYLRCLYIFDVYFATQLGVLGKNVTDLTNPSVGYYKQIKAYWDKFQGNP